MPKTYFVHSSDIQRYKRCRQYWDWASPIRSNLTPRDKYAPFFTGSLMHHVLEHWYKIGQDAQTSIANYMAKECTPEQRADPKLLEQATLVQVLFEHYRLWQHHDASWLSDGNFEFIANEQMVHLPLWRNRYADVRLIMTFDGVVKDLTSGKYYLWEIKTTKSVVQRQKQLDLDLQADNYANGAQRILDVPISGIIYTLIRKKIPDFPKVLTNGFLSQSRDQDITGWWYLKCIKEHHRLHLADREYRNEFIKENYSKILDHLLQEQNYFRRVLVKRSQAELDDSWHQLYAVTREMISKQTPIYLSEEDRCNFCLFRNPCIAKRQGRDYQAILDREYIFNDRYKDEIEA